VAAPTPDQKSALIAAHRKALAETPCKYFIEGQCPFGTSCFYKHGNETTETPKVAFVMKADGESSVKTEITLADFMKKK
jgi:E3 ubiquitin-protein ligase makorin